MHWDRMCGRSRHCERDVKMRVREEGGKRNPWIRLQIFFFSLQKTGDPEKTREVLYLIMIVESGTRQGNQAKEEKGRCAVSVTNEKFQRVKREKETCRAKS